MKGLLVVIHVSILLPFRAIQDTLQNIQQRLETRLALLNVERRDWKMTSNTIGVDIFVFRPWLVGSGERINWVDRFNSHICRVNNNITAHVGSVNTNLNLTTFEIWIIHSNICWPLGNGLFVLVRPTFTVTGPMVIKAGRHPLMQDQLQEAMVPVRKIIMGSEVKKLSHTNLVSITTISSLSSCFTLSERFFPGRVN